MSEKITTIRVRESTKDSLRPYKETYGTFEKGILELIESFERPHTLKKK